MILEEEKFAHVAQCEKMFTRIILATFEIPKARANISRTSTVSPSTLEMKEKSDSSVHFPSSSASIVEA